MHKEFSRVLAPNDSFWDYSGVGAQYGVLLPFSRQHELEADQIGLTCMARAGYHPREAVAFWKRMMAANQGSSKPPELMSTHPADQTRIDSTRTVDAGALEIDQGGVAASETRQF